MPKKKKTRPVGRPLKHNNSISRTAKEKRIVLPHGYAVRKRKK